MTAGKKALPTFALTAPSIWEYTPPVTHIPVRSLSSDEPSLIILCTWTGAQNRYIAKYTAIYQNIFPSTKIMVLATTTMDLCLRSSQQKQNRLIPAVKHIHHDGGILLHVFSEGGSNKACELAEVYYKITGKQLPILMLCFDSTPGFPRYLRLCNALNKSLPSIPLFRQITPCFCSAVLGAIWITYAVFKDFEGNLITRTRQRVLDTTYFDLTAPRCYLYSEEDAVVAWQDVHEHAEESLRKGVPVTEMMFEGSEHVEHARQNPDRYWGTIIAIWRSATYSSGCS
jgi:hypothetical protein